VVTKQAIADTTLRVIRMQERALGVEKRLRHSVEAGVEHPDLARALAGARAAVERAEALLGCLAAFLAECDYAAGRLSAN
jgi:hypothetical protein